MRNKQSIFQGVDLILVLQYALLVFIGWMNIYAVTYDVDQLSFFDLDKSYFRQLIWIGCAVVLIVMILFTDAQFFESFARFIYYLIITSLVLVLLVGAEKKGARSWFDIGGIFSIQPSEFAKFATALVTADYLSKYNVSIKQLKTKLAMVALIGMPAILIIAQPDPGSALVFAAFILVLYREGLSESFLLIGLCAILLFMLTVLYNTVAVNLVFIDFVLSGKIVLLATLFPASLWLGIYYQKRTTYVVFAVLFLVFFLWAPVSGKLIYLIAFLVLGRLFRYLWNPLRNRWLRIAGFVLVSSLYVISVNFIFENVFSDRHRNRINELLGITFNPQGTGYNVNQSKIAIGSGGFWGKGFLNGTQTKYDFVPEQKTDFVFCTIGEEWGFFGSFLLVVLFVSFFIRIIMIAERQKAKFSRIYGYSIACIFFIHFAINIGMTIGLAPVIGIPLPFFSYGGSSLWSFTLLLFTLIKMDSERKYIL